MKDLISVEDLEAAVESRNHEEERDWRVSPVKNRLVVDDWPQKFQAVLQKSGSHNFHEK